MNRFVSAVLIATTVVISSAAAVYAATNKETVVASIDSLVSDIRTTRAARADGLLTAATKLSADYDKAMTASGVSADDVDMLFAAGKISGTPFRQTVSSEYRTLVDSLFTDIDKTSSSLLSTRTDILLGYSDLTEGQKKVFDTDIAVARGQYNTFSTGSQATIDAFVARHQANLKTEVARLVGLAATNKDNIALIRDIRSRYATLETSLAAMKTNMEYVRVNILDTLQNNITFLSTEKASYAARMKANFDAGIEKALSYDRVVARKSDIEVYRDVLLARWNSYADTSFADDQGLLLSYLKGENIVKTEKLLRDKIYTASGVIRYADVFNSANSLVSEVQKLQSDITETNNDLSTLKLRYANNAAVSISTDIKTQLANAYSSKLAEYQDEFQAYIATIAADQTNLEERVTAENQANELLKQQNASYIRIMELEKTLLDTTLQGSHSVEFARDTITAYENRLTTISKNGDSRVQRRKQQLVYDARYQLVNRMLLEDQYIPYVKVRSSIAAAMKTKLASLTASKWTENTLEYLKKIDTKIDAALATNLSIKNTHLLLTVRRAVYDYLRSN